MGEPAATKDSGSEPCQVEEVAHQATAFARKSRRELAGQTNYRQIKGSWYWPHEAPLAPERG